MVDTYRSVSHTGWGRRIGNSIAGVLVGLGFCIAAFVLLWWNEGRAVRETRSLDEGASLVASVGTERVDAALQGKLIHVSGLVRPLEPLVEPDFGWSIPALGLRRDVEMYQWHERRETRERKTLGGGTETVTEYRYERKWSDEAIDSSRFEHPEGHANPGALPFPSVRRTVERAALGAYELGPALVERFDAWERFAPPSDAAPPAGFRATADGYHRGADAGSPQVGDVRIRFERVPEGRYSIVGRQAGSGIDAYPSEAGNAILLVESGERTAEAMFKAAHQRNTMLTWALRAGGFFALFIGIGLALKPLSVVADVVPLVGTLVAKGIGLVSFVLALFLGLTTVGIAWVSHRPLLGGALIALAVGATLLLRRRGAVAMPATPPMPPPFTPPPPPA